MLHVERSSSDSRTLGRVVAAALVGVLLLCFATGTEWWPFSKFSLFSEVRGPEQVSWSLNAIRPDGEIEAVNLTSLPESHWGSHHVLPTLDNMSIEHQRAAARAWLEAAGVDAENVRAVQVVRTTSHVPTDLDASATEVSRTVSLEIDLS